MFKKAIGYVKEEDFLGVVGAVDFISNTVTLVGDEESRVFDKDNVEVLYHAFTLPQEDHSVDVYDKDVLGAINGNLYQVELHKDGNVQLHNINEKLEVTSSGEKFIPTSSIIVDLSKVMELQGSVYELEVEVKPDFNVEIVKKNDGKHFAYYYACNNKEHEEIDLIKVLYFGSTLLKEENYERITVTYDDYLNSVEKGLLKSVTPSELQNYVTGVTYGVDTSANDNDFTRAHVAYSMGELDDEVECGDCDCADDECLFEESQREVDDSSVCDDCNKDLDICTCELW
jgi:hypothetical protein